MIGNLSGYLNIHRKTLQRAMKRRKSIEIDLVNQCWSFSSRLPRSDRKLTNEIKIIIENFLHDHTRVSPNIKDVLEEKKSLGSKDYKPEHAKHFLDMTQTQLYNKFVNDKVLSPFNISVSQRSFEKCKPWYVRINKQRVTCCCKTHMQFRYYYQVFRHIHGTLHTNNFMQGCGFNMPFESINAFISSLFCQIPDDQSFYPNACISGPCHLCGNLSLLEECVHESSLHEFGQTLVDVKKFKSVEYALKDGKTGKRVDLIIENVRVHRFMDDFKNNFIPKYVKHSQHARWIDNEFHQCRNTFTYGTILSVVDFAENYTLAPQEKIQSQYYNSQQVSIFVHIVYRHVDDSTEDNKKVLREYHFYVSDNRLHSPEFIKFYFSTFYNNLKERNIQMMQHLIWLDNCIGQFKNA